MKGIFKTNSLVMPLLIIIFFSALSVYSQIKPDQSNLILKDSVVVDTTYLTELEPITINSHGSKLSGYFSRAKGEGPHPTVILLHGSPGGNRDVLGLAQAAPRADWNALVFNYRGFYKSEGICSLKNSLEDVFSALNFIKSDEIVKKYRINVDHIALAGYSFGGNMALTAAASDSSIKYVISIAAADISEIARQAKKSDKFRAMFVETMNNRFFKGPVKGPGGKEAVEELLANSNKYDLVKHAKNLSEKSLLIIGGWNDQASTLEGHVLPLIRALQVRGAERVEKVIFDSNHSFEGKRTELADAVVSWLIDHHPCKKSASSEVQKELWNLEESYMLNYKDKNIEVLTEFWDEKFIGWPEWAEEPVDVNNAKFTLSKPSENKIISFKIMPQNMVLKGNIAVVYYLIDVNLENRAQEKSFATYRIIHTWLNENGKWQILGGMSAK